MGFDLPAEQQALRQAIRVFLAQERTPEVVGQALQGGRHSERL